MRSSDWSSDVCSSDLEAVCSRGLSGASPSPDITSDHATTGPTPNVRADDRRDSMDATFYAEHLLAARRPGHSLPQGLYSDAAIFDIDVSLRLGRASCRERVVQYVQIAVVGSSL